jgi:hypothetical protein
MEKQLKITEAWRQSQGLDTGQWYLCKKKTRVQTFVEKEEKIVVELKKLLYNRSVEPS